MMNLATAAAINNETRAFYKYTLKGANKIYRFGPDATAEQRDRMQRREEQAKAAHAILVADRAGAFGGKSNIERGREPHGMQNAPDGRAGFAMAAQCGEMARVAMFIAADKLLVPTGQLFIVSFQHTAKQSGMFAPAFETWSFGHQLLSLGDCRGRELKDVKDAFAVDPWANVACRWSDYATAFAQQMAKWTRDGKRVIVDGAKATGGHLNPDNAFLLDLPKKAKPAISAADDVI